MSGTGAGIELRGVRIVMSDGVGDGAAVVEELAGSRWAREARVVKRGTRGMVCSGRLEALGGAEVVVKTHRLQGVREVVGAALGVSRVGRQARGARVVAGAGSATARVHMVARGTDAGGARVEVLVMERVPGVSVAHHAARRDLDGPARRVVAERLGAQIDRLARAGVVNRDHKASNIVVRFDEAGLPEPVVIDTVGIRRADPRAARVRMLYGLVIELVGIGALPSAPDRMRVVRSAMGGTRADRKRVWRAVSALVRMHGDARPKDDPVAEPEEGAE